MVKFAATLATLAVLFIAGCNEEASKTTTPAEAQHAVSVADTASGSVVETGAIANEKIRLRLDSGTTFRYKALQMSSITQDTAVVTTNSTHYYTKSVKGKRSDGAFEMTMKFDSLDIAVIIRDKKTGLVKQSGGYSSKRDTAIDPTDIQKIQFWAVLGEPVTVILSEMGQINEISGVSSIVNKIANRLPQAFPNQQVKDQATQYVQGMMYGSFIGQEFVPYPPNALDSTLSWTNDQTSPVGNMFRISTTTVYRIVSVRNVKGHRIATIEGTLTGKLFTQPPPPEAGIQLVLKKADVTGSSHAVLDLNTGATIAKRNHLKLDVNAHVKNLKTGETKTASQMNESRYEVELIP